MPIRISHFLLTLLLLAAFRSQLAAQTAPKRLGTIGLEVAVTHSLIGDAGGVNHENVMLARLARVRR